MKTFLSLLIALALVPTLHAEITKADIIKTVEHLQERCHQAEAAQTAAEQKLEAEEGHGRELQANIDSLAKHDQSETARADTLTAQNKTLAGRLDKLVLALAFVAGLLVWSFSSRFAAILPPPYSILGPIAAGIATAGIVGAWLRYVL